MKKPLFFFLLLFFSTSVFSQELFVAAKATSIFTQEDFKNGAYTNGDTVIFRDLPDNQLVYFGIARHGRHGSVTSVAASCFEEILGFVRAGIVRIDNEVYAYYRSKHPRVTSSLNNIPYTIK